jgi:MerR family transcriptional regulator, light-induced transcriptional regulator
MTMITQQARRFTIRQLEMFSGVKAHTIRIWEQRFQIIKPSRTPGNQRFYYLEEVESLLDIALLNKVGFSISQLAEMSETEIKQRIRNLESPEARINKALNKLIVSMYIADGDYFEKVLNDAVDELGVHNTIEKLVIPFLEKVDLYCYTDTSNEVHLAVCAIRRKIILGIENVVSQTIDGRTALLFLPKGEHYDLTLLYMNYLLKREGIKVIYLGTNVPKENLANVLSNKKPDLVYTYVNKYSPAIDEYAAVLTELADSQLLYVCHPVKHSYKHLNCETKKFVQFNDITCTLVTKGDLSQRMLTNR